VVMQGLRKFVFGYISIEVDWYLRWALRD